MALVVETGAVIEGANSYVSLDDANEYLTDRDIEVTLSVGQLLRGADYINSFRTRYKGYKQSAITSNMQWPRAFAVIDDYLIRGDVIPDVIPDAQIEAALEFALGKDPLSTVDTRPIKREKVDVIEREYDTSRSGNTVQTYRFRRVLTLLRPVFKNIGMRVMR